MLNNKLIFFITAISIILLLPSTTLAQKDNNLRGPAFHATAKALPMSKDWQQQAIQYEEWARGADLALSLDQQLYAALLPIINRFASEQKVNIKVQEGTCGISAGQLLQKSADITGFCCPPGETDRLPGLAYHTLGIAALHIIVNKTNPIDNLSLDQVQNIFQGKITSWRSLPGMEHSFPAEDTIHPIARLHCKNRPGHWRLLLDNEDLFSARMIDIGTIRDMITRVSSDKNAIGYEVLWHVDQLAPDGTVKSIHINNSNPNRPEDVLTLAYPLYRTFSITTWEPTNNQKTLAQQLITYIQAHMKEIDKRHGIIPATRLKEAGWKFTNNELTGEPE